MTTIANYTVKRGDDEEIDFVITSPVDPFPVRDLTDGKLWFTIKRRVSDTDANAVVQKTWPPGDANGIIVADPTLGALRVRIKPADLKVLSNRDQDVKYDLQFEDAAGFFSTPIQGTLTVTSEVTETLI